MDSKIFFVVLICLLCYGQGQQCRNKNNWRVDWWVMIQFPGSVSTGYAYFDSRFAAPTFAVYTQQPDSATSPLNKTLNQIANLSMYSIAWNDQAPDGSQSTTKAHSKSVGAYDPKNQSGFFLIHSIPQYPSFFNGVINSSISPSQQIYGQHLLCISVDKVLSLKLLPKLFPIRPLVYSQLYNASEILYQVIHSASIPPDYDSLFSYLSWQKNGTEWSMIFKNGFKNSSLFEDGVNEMLGSGLLSQTWGRPLQAPWCGGNYPTGNVKQIKFSQNITWSTTQDHSKWIVSKNTNHSCFGDMNRMESQWGRGGAFYCIKSPLLNQAMKSIIKTSEECATA